MTQHITVKATINAPVNVVWEYYTAPQHVTQWNSASEDWHTPQAHNDLRVGGTFSYRMEAKDKSAGFDFGGTYTAVKLHEHFAYTMGDGRTVDVTFEKYHHETIVTVTFEAELTNSIEHQHDGWQAILNNFKKYVEEQQ